MIRKFISMDDFQKNIYCITFVKYHKGIQADVMLGYGRRPGWVYASKNYLDENTVSVK